MAPKIYFDGTESFWRPENNTGIQRVVREVCRRCQSSAPLGVEACAVQFNGRRWAKWDIDTNLFYRLFTRSRLFTLRCRSLRRLSRPKIKNNPLQVKEIISFIVGLIGSGIGSIFSSLAKRLLRRGSPVQFNADDILVVIEYPWTRTKCITALQEQGVKFIAVIHDCIPLTHPEFYQRDVKAFGHFLEWVLTHADGVMSVSIFSQQEIESRQNTPGRPWVDYFHLGSDFLHRTPGSTPPQLIKAFSRPCFLMVGTIAPHKNHKQVLDAMDILWQNHHETHLLIIGKVGWQADELLGRIYSHPQLGKKLFIFHELNDGDLAYAYGHAHALVAASYVEGFGLPVVEALSQGLAVIASDIPVFREIAGTSVEFFPLDNAQSLAEIIQGCATGPRSTVKNAKWLSWDESTQLLITKVLKNIQGVKPVR